MPVSSHIFHRLVVGLTPGIPGQSMRLAAELAEILHLELLGLFLEDTGVRNLAGIPFAREFRPLGGGWHPIRLERLSQDLELVARTTERLFAETMRSLSIRHQFEVRRGPIAETIAAISQTSDIFMIVEPSTAAERSVQQFSWLIDSAFRSVAAVIIVPTHIARSKGPIVAIAAGPDDPSISVAAAIANVAGEELVIVHAYEAGADQRGIQQLAAELNLKINQITAGKAALSDPAVCSQTLENLRERLIVMTRGGLANEFAPKIIAARRVPVLVLEPLEILENAGVMKLQQATRS
jgi:hypothetical protein